MRKPIIIIAVVCMIVLIPASLGGAGVQAHLWLNDANNFPESENGYTTSDSDFTLYIANEAGFGANNIKLIVSVPGSVEGTLPVQTVTINGATVIPGTNPWIWGAPCATKTDGKEYCMQPSGTFPAYYATYNMGPIGSNGATISANINIAGGPTVRFDAWGFDSKNRIILKDPFSHDLTYIPEFPTIALPIASILAIMFIMQKRKKGV